jgi:hypothetical protein
MKPLSLLAIDGCVLTFSVRLSAMPPFPAMTDERREQLRQHTNRIRKLRGVKNLEKQAANTTTPAYCVGRWFAMRRLSSL